MRDTIPKVRKAYKILLLNVDRYNPLAQDGSRGWYKPEGYAAFLTEAPMSTPTR